LRPSPLALAFDVLRCMSRDGNLKRFRESRDRLHFLAAYPGLRSLRLRSGRARGYPMPPLRDWSCGGSSLRASDTNLLPRQNPEQKAGGCPFASDIKRPTLAAKGAARVGHPRLPVVVRKANSKATATTNSKAADGGVRSTFHPHRHQGLAWRAKLARIKWAWLGTLYSECFHGVKLDRVVFAY